MEERICRCGWARGIQITQKANEPVSKRLILGLLLPHASHSAEKSEPRPNAEEMKPNPCGPLFSTAVAKSGRTTLKLMPNREITPTTAMIKNTEGVRATYARPSRKLCNVLCFD